MSRPRQIIQKLLKAVFRQNYLVYKRDNCARLLLTSGIIGFSSLFAYSCGKTDNTIFPRHVLCNNEINLNNNDNNGKISSRKSDLNFIMDVTKKCAPSVVAVEVKNSMRLSPETGEPMLTSSGSGFVVTDDGWILTNAHVIMNKPNALYSVVTTSGESYDAVAMDIDLKLDLALLKISCNKLTPLPLGSSQDVAAGEWVVAIGSPLALRHSITAGVVSSINRDAKDLGLTQNSIKYIQTDAAITFGHSGGPLVNLDGEVIGVNNLRITAGIAFAIPVDYVKEFILRSKLHSVENERKQNSMNNPKFGIATLAIKDKNVQKMLSEENIKLPNNVKGLLVWTVVKNSLADKAGFIAGDVITHVNKNPVTDISSFYSYMTVYKKQNISFTIYRRGIKTELHLKQSDKT